MTLTQEVDKEFRQTPASRAFGDHQLPNADLVPWQVVQEIRDYLISIKCDQQGRDFGTIANCLVRKEPDCCLRSPLKIEDGRHRRPHRRALENANRVVHGDLKTLDLCRQRELNVDPVAATGALVMVLTSERP